jgi:hypothetical protein
MCPKTMRPKTLLTLAVLTLTSIMVFAANVVAADVSSSNKPEVVLSKDGRRMYVANGARTVTRAASSHAGLVAIFDNIGEAYPLGTYWCCQSVSITGPKASGRLPEYWLAAAFTPRRDHTVTLVEVAVNLMYGSDVLDLSLSSDANGLPGTPLKTWHIRSLPAPGTCCTLEVGKDRAGIPVTGGTQYWIVLTTNGDDSNTFAGWNVEDINQVDTYDVPIAYYCSDDRGGSCGNNDAWTLDQSTSNQGPAFAVLGR